jgi:hypothetical protein
MLDAPFWVGGKRIDSDFLFLLGKINEKRFHERMNQAIGASLVSDCIPPKT